MTQQNKVNTMGAVALTPYIDINNHIWDCEG